MFLKGQRHLHSMKNFYSKSSEFFRETSRTKLVPSANNNSSEGLRKVLNFLIQTKKKTVQMQDLSQQHLYQLQIRKTNTIN